MNEILIYFRTTAYILVAFFSIMGAIKCRVEGKMSMCGVLIANALLAATLFLMSLSVMFGESHTLVRNTLLTPVTFIWAFTTLILSYKNDRRI